MKKEFEEIKKLLKLIIKHLGIKETEGTEEDPPKKPPGEPGK